MNNDVININLFEFVVSIRTLEISILPNDMNTKDMTLNIDNSYPLLMSKDFSITISNKNNRNTAKKKPNCAMLSFCSFTNTIQAMFSVNNAMPKLEINARILRVKLPLYKKRITNISPPTFVNKLRMSLLINR